MRPNNLYWLGFSPATCDVTYSSWTVVWFVRLVYAQNVFSNLYFQMLHAISVISISKCPQNNTFLGCLLRARSYSCLTCIDACLGSSCCWCSYLVVASTILLHNLFNSKNKIMFESLLLCLLLCSLVSSNKYINTNHSVWSLSHMCDVPSIVSYHQVILPKTNNVFHQTISFWFGNILWTYCHPL